MASAATIEQREQLEDFLGLEAGAFDAQFVDRRFDVGDAAELDADGGAARRRTAGAAAACRYWMASPASARPSSSCARSAMRADLFQFALAQRARDVAAHQLPQGFEFEDFSAGLQDVVPLG